MKAKNLIALATIIASLTATLSNNTESVILHNFFSENS